MSNGHVWRAAQERLRQQMTRAQFDTWLRGTWLTSSGDGATLLCVRTTFAKELLESRYLDRIAAAIAGVTGQPCALRVAVAPSGPGSQETADAAPEPEPRQSQPQAAAHRTGAYRLAHATQAQQSGPTLFTDDAPNDAPEAAGEHDTPPNVEPRERRTLMPPATRRRPIASGGPGSPRSGRVRAALDRTRPGEPEDEPSFQPGAMPAVPTQARTRVDERETRVQRGREANAASEAGGASERTSVTTAAPAQRGGIDGTTTMDEQRRIARTRNAGDMEDERYARVERDLARPAAGFEPATAHGVSGGPMPMPSDGAPLPDYADRPIPQLRLNPRYTFSTFIVGSGNRLAHAASQAVAEAPGLAYNPLFLYGGVGLGKTHLLHAIGHTAIDSGLTVLYVSSETFTNEIINAIRYRTTEEFRAKYRSVDVLLVDDIQFIAGKDSTEEEFFHTFNALHENSKQIVMCSDRPPKAIVSLAERLRSRFEWGLIADIQPPDQETRVAILRAKADMLRRDVPDEVINFLATRVQSNIRELEGSFNRLFAFAQLQGLPLTIDTAKAALASLATDGRQRRVDIQEVVEAVADYYRVSPDDLRGKQRDKHIVVPRQIAMYLMRQETEASLLEIGQALGGRDHSTVLHGCDKISREVNENTTLRKEVLAIRQQLLG